MQRHPGNVIAWDSEFNHGDTMTRSRCLNRKSLRALIDGRNADLMSSVHPYRCYKTIYLFVYFYFFLKKKDILIILKYM